jgi:N-acyl-D-aspartate/D-glutamate deacylase
MLDVVIRGGDLIDGTGAPRRRADVGLRDGKIACIGQVSESASRSVDASGLIVAPGFIDIHTHYDAQVLWDPFLMPSPEHGVTTVLGGNCGISVAPSPEQEVGWLNGLLARVEEIPTTALDAVLVQGFTSFKEYLDSIDLGLGVNAAFMVGHSAIRRAVMGRTASEGEASPDQIAAMCSLVRNALEAGAAGFSTAIIANHIDSDGRPAPPQFASFDEIRELSSACRGRRGTILQMTPDNLPASPAARRLMFDMSLLSHRPFTFTAVGAPAHFEVVEEGQALMANLRPQAQLTDGFGDRLQLTDSLMMRHWPSPWPQILAMPLEETLRQLSDPATREKLHEVAMSAPPRALSGQQFADRWTQLEVNDVTDPALTPFEGRRIVDIALEQHVDPFDAWLDLAVADQCRTGFISYEPDQRRVGPGYQVMVDPRSLWGLFDSGAHLTSMVGGSSPTRIIEVLVRQEDLVSLEYAVHRLTGHLAQWWGLADRGLITEGFCADLVMFDPDRIGRGRMRRLADWPGNTAHLTCDAIGVHRTFVNGTEVVVDGTYTGERPGRVLRSGTDIL